MPAHNATKDAHKDAHADNVNDADARYAYEYAIVRVVPRVERGEYVNVGVVLLCRQRRYLGGRIAFGARQQAGLRALAPDLDLAEVEQHLESIPLICRGGAAGGPIGLLSQAERFHWLVAPASTIIQPSPVHTGLCSDPAASLDHLMNMLVHDDAQ
jgi:hypothetical protein